MKRAAKQGKRAWLDNQLQARDWRPITNVNKPVPQRVLVLSDTANERTGANNAEIYANHFARNQ